MEKGVESKYRKDGKMTHTFIPLLFNWSASIHATLTLTFFIRVICSRFSGPCCSENQLREVNDDLHCIQVMTNALPMESKKATAISFFTFSWERAHRHRSLQLHPLWTHWAAAGNLSGIECSDLDSAPAQPIGFPSPLFEGSKRSKITITHQNSYVDFVPHSM